MQIYPIEYTKESFIKYLEKNNVLDDLINRFKNTPVTLIYKNANII